MSSGRSQREFTLIKKCRAVYKDICEMQATADKNYRYTVCKDLTELAKELTHTVRKANDIRAGNEERIKMQKRALGLIDEIKDLLPAAGDLLKTGVKHEAQIELSIDNLRLPLQNWIASDEKVLVTNQHYRMRKIGWDLYGAKKDLEMVKGYLSHHRDERTAVAFDEAKAAVRILTEEYKEAVMAYDRAMKQLRDTREAIHKDDSILTEVLREIGKKEMKREEKPTEEEVREKNRALAEVNRNILAANGNKLEKATQRELGARVQPAGEEEKNLKTTK